MDKLELEIAELQQKIEEKRNLLEQQGGIVEEKELVSSAVREMFTAGNSLPVSNQAIMTTDANTTAHTAPKTYDGKGSYLDHLDEQTATLISGLIQKVPTVGIAKVVAEAELAGPYAVDALHDALVDKLYEELKNRGIVK